MLYEENGLTISQGEHHAGRELTHVSEAEFHTEFTGSERPPRDVQNCDIYQEAISHPVKKPKVSVAYSI